MGNNVTRVSKGAGVRKARVLLPDGDIVLLDGPLEAADLMMEHVNHMVMHCSIPEIGSIGKRSTMTIMQPHEKLQPGQSYVVHPIPAQYTKSKPQPLSVPMRSISKIAIQEDGDKTQGQEDPRKKSARRSSMKRFQNRVADSAPPAPAPAPTPGRELGPDLTSSAPRSSLNVDAAARALQQDREDQVMDEEDDDILLNLNLYMGWRPALESIPESPVGYNHQLDMMQAPPLLCV